MAGSIGEYSSDGDSEIEDQKKRQLMRVLEVYAIRENKLGLLTPRKAFNRWIIFVRQGIARSLLNTMLINCRISPSKASWILLAATGSRARGLSAVEQQQNLRQGLNQIIGLVQKVLYRNKHHYFFQGRLLTFRLPLVHYLVAGLNGSMRSALHALRLFSKRDSIRICLVKLAFLEKASRDLMVSGFWRLRLQAASRKKKSVHFKMDSQDSHLRAGSSVGVRDPARPRKMTCSVAAVTSLRRLQVAS